MAPGWGRWLAAVGLLALALAVAGMHRDGWGRSLKAGTEVFAVDPARVVEVSFRAADLRMMAHRWDTRERFTIICLTKRPGPPAVCRAGPGFDTVLQQLTSLKLKRTLSPEQAEAYLKRQPRHGWAEVAVRDDSALEPFRALITPVAASSTEALVQFRGATYVVGFEAQVFRLIAGGCAALGVTEATTH